MTEETKDIEDTSDYYRDTPLEERGPHHIPEEIVKKAAADGYVYKFKNNDPKSPYRLERAFRQGWVPVTRAELGTGQSYLDQYGIKLSNLPSSVGNYVTSIGRDGVESYLCKMKIETYKIIQDMKHKAVDKTEESINGKLAVGGSSTASYSTPVFNNNHIFKR